MYSSSATWEGKSISKADLYDTPKNFGMYRLFPNDSWYIYGARVPIFTTPNIDTSNPSVIRIIFAEVDSGNSAGNVKLHVGVVRQGMADTADDDATWYSGVVAVDGTQWKFYTLDLEVNLTMAPYMLMFYRDCSDSEDTYSGDIGVFYTAVLCPITGLGQDKEGL
jgi:hypothetical protein